MIPIPPELINLIIESTQSGLDILQLDKEALAACSLVSSTWRSFAQPQLFQDVRLGVLNRPLDQFLAFLEAKSHLAEAIRLLDIYYFDVGLIADDIDWDDAGEDPPANDVDNVDAAAPADSAAVTADLLQPTPGSLCPSLIYNIAMQLSKEARVNLKLEGVHIPGWPRDTPLPTTRARLYRLTLLSPLYQTPKQPYTVPFDFLGLFDVDELRLFNGRSDSPFALEFLEVPDEISLATLGSPRPIARYVEVIGLDDLAMSTLAHGGFDPKHLTTLSFTLKNYDALVLAGMMLQLHSRCIHDLRIDVTNIARAHLGGPVDVICADLFKLASCICLEKLTMSWWAPTLTDATSAPGPEIYEALAAMVAFTPRTLRKLKLYPPYVDRSPETLAPIMRLLVPIIETAIAVLPSLETVTVVILSARSMKGKCADVLRSTVVPRKVADSGKLQYEYRETYYQ